MRLSLKRFFLFIFLFSPVSLMAQQQFNQTVRGVVMEKNTQEVLPGANVIVVANEKQYFSVTNENGEFVVAGVPVGRCNITVTVIGFVPYISNNILVYSGKETVLEVVLT